MNPSHDFLGDIDGIILFLPYLTPIKKAKVSNVQVSINSYKIRTAFQDLWINSSNTATTVK